jgi:chemotaxis signal transduction protein
VSEFRTGQYLTLRIGRGDFAILADHVRGVLPLHELVSDANQGDLAGTALFQGMLLPVFDLRQKLTIKNGSYGRHPSIVIVSAPSGLVGFAADCVSEIIYARAHDFRAGKIRIGRARPILDPASLFAEDLVTP